MPSDFKNLLLFQTLGKFANVNFCSPNECDLFIYGPYFRESKKIKYYPKFLRKYLINPYPWNRKLKPITMFYTCENLRWNIMKLIFQLVQIWVLTNQLIIDFPTGWNARLESF